MTVCSHLTELKKVISIISCHLKVYRFCQSINFFGILCLYFKGRGEDKMDFKIIPEKYLTKTINKTKKCALREKQISPGEKQDRYYMFLNNHSAQIYDTHTNQFFKMNTSRLVNYCFDEENGYMYAMNEYGQRSFKDQRTIYKFDINKQELSAFYCLDKKVFKEYRNFFICFIDIFQKDYFIISFGYPKDEDIFYKLMLFNIQTEEAQVIALPEGYKLDIRDNEHYKPHFIIDDMIYIVLTNKATAKKVLFRYKKQEFTEIDKYSSEIVIPHLSDRFIVIFCGDWVTKDGRYSHFINSQIVIYDRKTKEKRKRNISGKLPNEINLAHIYDDYYLYVRDIGKIYFYNLLTEQEDFQIQFNDYCYFNMFIGNNKFCYTDWKKAKEESNMHDLIIVEMQRK